MYYKYKHPNIFFSQINNNAASNFRFELKQRQTFCNSLYILSDATHTTSFCLTQSTPRHFAKNKTGTSWSLKMNVTHKSYRLLLELSFCPTRNSLHKNDFVLEDRDLDTLAGAIVGTSSSIEFLLSRTCRTIPTNSSSTLWFRTTEISTYLQWKRSDTSLASTNRNQLHYVTSIL